MNIKKILNPVDGSAYSIRSTQCAIELAKPWDAQIILLHCHARFPIVSAEPRFQKAVTEINKASEALVEPFIKILEAAEMKFDVRILEGSAGNKIAEVARIERIDLIVMGSRGVTDFIGLFLGSVAHTVLQKSDCPVFITK